ncbi:MAG: cation:proton antiporter [Bacillales bacterium]|nr:cation:proton antiporter [Bacillales bacterium]
MNTILTLGIVLVAGLLSTRLMKLIRFPNVTGYLLVGLILGPILHLIFGDNMGFLDDPEGFGIVVDVALGFIAFIIGSEFKFKDLKKVGGKIIFITFMEATCALIFISGSLAIYYSIKGTLAQNLPIVLLLGAMGCATAPASTLMVIKQYKAHGEFTNTLLYVVGLDDAFGLIYFSILFEIAKVLVNPGVQITAASLLLLPLLQVFLSLAIGAALGAILALACKWFHSRANRLILMITVIFIGVGLAVLLQDKIELSSLLICMMIGAVFCNMREDAIYILDEMDRWTPIVFMVFFIICGAELDLTVIPVIGVAGILYVIFRIGGKYVGASTGAMMTKQPKNIIKNLGIALVPQEGVAIGMARMAYGSLGGETGSQILAIILVATLVFEMIGPLTSKFALIKAGDITLEPKVPKIKKPKKTAS